MEPFNFAGCSFSVRSAEDRIALHAPRIAEVGGTPECRILALPGLTPHELPGMRNRGGAYAGVGVAPIGPSGFPVWHRVIALGPGKKSGVSQYVTIHRSRDASRPLLLEARQRTQVRRRVESKRHTDARSAQVRVRRCACKRDCNCRCRHHCRHRTLHRTRIAGWRRRNVEPRCSQRCRCRMRLS